MTRVAPKLLVCRALPVTLAPAPRLWVGLELPPANSIQPPALLVKLPLWLPLWLPQLVRARMPCYTLTEPLLLTTALKTVFAAPPALVYACMVETLG